MKAESKTESQILEIIDLMKQLLPEKVEAVMNFIMFLKHRHKNEEKNTEDE